MGSACATWANTTAQHYTALGVIIVYMEDVKGQTIELLLILSNNLGIK